jgi:methyl-accepting chemotaxis protein
LDERYRFLSDRIDGRRLTLRAKGATMNVPVRGGGRRLRVKLIAFLTIILVPLALVTWTIAVQQLHTTMTAELVSKGAVIATTVASTSADLIGTRRTSRIKPLVDELVATDGVAYVMVYDRDRQQIADTFASGAPSGLVEKNVVPRTAARQVRDIEYVDPVSRSSRRTIDITVPVLGGQLGAVRVGMDKNLIEAAVLRQGRVLLIAFALAILGALIAGIVFTRRLTRPIEELVRVARAVGQGDLSATVTVRSTDEIGQLAETFNETIVALRSQLTTEAERDEERRRHDELQQHIVDLLDTVMLIAEGDLTRRGEVTRDMPGSVADAINLMIEEIGTMIAEVRTMASAVVVRTNEMLQATATVARGAQKQCDDALGARRAIEQLTVSVRRVAGSAEKSAGAAAHALTTAQLGEGAIGKSLAGMQRIRAEVQAIAKKIKRLGDRSLEISVIVGTVDEIASHTHLLAVNAAIEAAGAGEAGVRFSMVAEEIRKLAERSAQATKDIGALIHGVQEETQELVALMENGTRQVESGHRATVDVGESLKQIADIAQRSAALAEEISHATREQVQDAEGVTTAIEAIVGVAVETHRAVSATRTTMDGLVRVAEGLQRSLTRFRLVEPEEGASERGVRADADPEALEAAVVR